VKVFAQMIHLLIALNWVAMMKVMIATKHAKLRLELRMKIHADLFAKEEQKTCNSSPEKNNTTT
jgi:hypothetical protein